MDKANKLVQLLALVEFLAAVERWQSHSESLSDYRKPPPREHSLFEDIYVHGANDKRLAAKNR